MIERSQIDSLLERFRAVEHELSDPELSANPRRLRQRLREHAALQRLKDAADQYFRRLEEREQNRTLAADPATEDDLRLLAKTEISKIEAELPAFERQLLLALLPEDPAEDRNALVEIRAGTGGDEAALFAGDLFRMYSRFAEHRHWKVEVIDAAPSDIGGYKEAVFMVRGAGAFGALRYESGGHRVQRVPATESQGRIHTSAATVAVFPEAEPEDDIELPAEELRFDIYCSSGPGGQGVNTTYSAVRVTHLPTGLVAQSQDQRSQHQNREKALAVLKARVLDRRRMEEAARQGTERRNLIGSGDRSQRIRTYNFPQNRLTDHRINLTLFSLNRVIEGEMEELLNALREYDLEQRTRHELAHLGAE